MACNQLEALAVCCYVIITELARYNEKKNDVSTLWCASFLNLFNRLDRNGSISSKCIVCNHFVAFSVSCCTIITEFAHYNEKKLTRGPSGGRSVCSPPVE